jgi:predicted helicase
MTTQAQFNKILKKYRTKSFSERDKGERFERLMKSFLLTDPQYRNKLKEVWLWEEFPARRDFGGSDTGIDLVALTNEGDYWAIQCKFYKEGSIIDKPAVDSFLSTSSRSFSGVDIKTTRFSNRLWIDTTGRRWGKNAEEAIQNQDIPINRIGLAQLKNAPIDWEKLENGTHGEAAQTKKKSPFEHQKNAMDSTHKHFKDNDRGKLIMACGTGKTYTSLCIAENETKSNGLILFLVPSIALLGQTLREWSADASKPINPICICSDPRITKKQAQNDDSDLTSIIDLALPASTNIKQIVKQFKALETIKNKGMTVVFSTYQSIDVIAQAQEALITANYPKTEFDLIICDEAHRTTGVTLLSSDSSSFVKVHDNDFIKAKKRLYMTATPRLFSDDAKSKAAQSEAVLCSMDDENIYGKEVYRIGFGEAVEKNLLTDYKVLVLTLSDKDVSPAIQKMISNEDNEIDSDDASKLIGCINALSKQVIGDDNSLSSDPLPMKRAVAFCPRIIDSQRIKNTFNTATEVYINDLPSKKRESMVSVEAKHIDGTMSAPYRDELLSWLKDDSEDCRILTNVRCLSEGVDVPSLDAVLFLSARNSQVDVVQSVGRVMRKSPGKKYGYIIIPVIVPSDISPEDALKDNKRYAVVWTVLNALRAHDDRFNATINKIDLNKQKPATVNVLGPGTTFGEDGKPKDRKSPDSTEFNEQLSLQFEALQSAVFARLVTKVGDRRYWEQWAKSVAKIAERQVERITNLIARDDRHKIAFGNFLKGLQKNINPSISELQAIEMLSQHIITKPVFEALFEDYSFVKNNAVSNAMQNMLSLLEEQAIEKDLKTLESFYHSVKQRAAGIDNSEGKQKIIIELYDKFFKTAFPKMVEQLGIVYTPVEVVDFIIHSINDVLKEEFGRSLSDENVHVLDPFTGTGTFITRLIQSGLIDKKDLPRKYAHELHANEIVLLAYYIAAVNVENAYHDQIDGEFQSFDGICLTDTFQLGEKGNEDLFSDMFPQNSERVQKQRNAPLRVIIGNPPYSVGQKSANDNAQNQSYEALDSRISNTYAKATNATNKNSLYDSYIKAFRWASDRIDKENGGVIGFISNGAWLEGNAQDGFRKVLEKEFSKIYVFNLRGNARTQGELRRKEKDNVFGQGTRTNVSIAILAKNPKVTNKKAIIQYHDIGDYLSQEEKLNIISKFGSVSKINWKTLKPNEEGDWINKRNDAFGEFTPIQPQKKFNLKSDSFFVVNSMGVGSSRDAWVYNSSKPKVLENMLNMVSFYNEQVDGFQRELGKNLQLDVKKYISNDPKKISWSSSLVPKVQKGEKAIFELNKVYEVIYRPFFKQRLYYGDKMIHRRGQTDELFPNEVFDNFIINLSGTSGNKDMSSLMTNKISDLHLNGDVQAFPLYYYEKIDSVQITLFDTNPKQEYVRRDGVSDFILERARVAYGKRVEKEDIFYYVYGLLHSSDYRKTYANDLKKMLPRIPLVDKPKYFWAFSKAGRALADLHINYEQVAPHSGVMVKGADSEFYTVQKIRYPKRDGEVNGKKKRVDDTSTILYNSQITLSNIPDKAYDYVVNGKSAIHWIMERYQVSVDKKSGIKNDPNDWCDEVGNPRYILDLLLSIINVSVQTVDIVNSLPKLEFE